MNFNIWEDSYNEYFIVDEGGNTINGPYAYKENAQIFLEMLEALIEAYYNMDSGNFKEIEELIKKVTGLSIEEVLQ